MRKFLPLCLFAILLLSCGNTNIQRFRSYPDVVTVAKKLDHTYHFYHDPEVSYSLAKKPKGWYVVRTDNVTMKPLSDALFWSADKNRYEEIPQQFFKTSPENTQQESISPRTISMQYSYDHSLYFGYEGWDDDAIHDLENAGSLNDTLLEALARAYGNKCMQLTRPDRQVNLQQAGTMSESAVSDFCKWGNKDIETYRKLLALNPEYETMVGKVQTKLSNEYLFLWSELNEKNHKKEAAQFLVDGLYDELMLNFAKNLLMGAKPQAVIFCSGDNDTYPLWYVQEKMGFRKDVAVVNTSLIALPDWLMLWKAQYGFELGLPEQVYRDSLTEYILLDRYGDSRHMIEMNELKNALTIDKQAHTTDASYAKTLMLPSSTFHLSWKSEDVTAPMIRLKQSYLVKNELAMLDIIASNLGKRPLYYAHTAIFGDIYDALKEEHKVVEEGLLVQVTADTVGSVKVNDQLYNLALFKTNMESKYNFGLKNVKSLQVEQLAGNYVYMFHALCDALLITGDTTGAVEMAQRCVQEMPLSLFTDPVNDYFIGDDLRRAGKTEDGRKYLSAAVDKIKASYEKETDAGNLNRFVSVLERCSMLKEDRLSALATEATHLIDPVQKRLNELTKNED